MGVWERQLFVAGFPPFRLCWNQAGCGAENPETRFSGRRRLSRPNGTLQGHIDSLGDEKFGRVFNAVWSHWSEAQVRYEEYKELFGTQEDCDLLNAVAPQFFGYVHQVFWQDLVLHVTRLTDRSPKALSVKSLEKCLTRESDRELRAQVQAHRENAVKAAVPLVDWRNRHIAHRSQSLVIGTASTPLATVRLIDCKEVLRHVLSAINAIEQARMDGTTLDYVSAHPSARGLLEHLKGLVEGVQFAASNVDPEYLRALNPEKARQFLQTVRRTRRHFSTASGV